MKKKLIIILVCIVILSALLIGGISFYQKWRIDHAIIKVELKNNLELEVYSKVRLKDLIQSINGKIEKNFEIDTTVLGKKTIEFSYVNEEHIKVPYKFQVEIVDRTPPVISLYHTYSVEIGEDINLSEAFFCGDNYDDHPSCVVEGTYDLYQVGVYPLVYRATDNSGNETVHSFNLNVHEKVPSLGNNSNDTSTTLFEDIVASYKNADTKIGIDVSKWQGDIDFQKVKEAGVEFAFIRVGHQKGIGGEYVLDEKFEQNIKGFNEVGIPVGVYFYTYADSKKEAIKQAKWVLRQIKKGKVTLPIAFDWENFPYYQEFGLSFYHLTEMANAFMDTVSKGKYQGMLYSSKSYLENMWMKTKYPIWLAHYTTRTDYQGSYMIWQLCDDGKVEGISDNAVDIDVLYSKNAKTSLEK